MQESLSLVFTEDLGLPHIEQTDLFVPVQPISKLREALATLKDDQYAPAFRTAYNALIQNFQTQRAGLVQKIGKK
jgi:hypothetical protein